MIKSQMIVSVLMCICNHEEYIEESVKGVLMKECDFDNNKSIQRPCLNI